MDRQSETNMQGKDTQPANQEVVPDCSSISYIANKGSGHRRFFSSIGVGILEATLEGCENQEEFPEVHTKHCTFPQLFRLIFLLIFPFSYQLYFLS